MSALGYGILLLMLFVPLRVVVSWKQTWDEDRWKNWAILLNCLILIGYGLYLFGAEQDISGPEYTLTHLLILGICFEMIIFFILFVGAMIWAFATVDRSKLPSRYG